MNKTITSREAILLVSKNIVAQGGLQNINIREVAKQCNVSVGSIYNYFPTKSDLIVATIESIWKEIMKNLNSPQKQSDFKNFIATFFHDVRKDSKDYPNFFNSHSLNAMQLDRSKGRAGMEQYFERIKSMFDEVLSRDEKVKQDAFTDTFTKKDFFDFILSNMITLLVKEEDSCEFLLEIITRIIY